MGGPPGGGPDMAAFPLNSVKALVRHMGTFHVLGVSPQHNPLSKGRDQTLNLMVPSRIR